MVSAIPEERLDVFLWTHGLDTTVSQLLSIFTPSYLFLWSLMLQNLGPEIRVDNLSIRFQREKFGDIESLNFLSSAHTFALHWIICSLGRLLRFPSFTQIEPSTERDRECRVANSCHHQSAILERMRDWISILKAQPILSILAVPHRIIVQSTCAGMKAGHR